MLASMTYGEMPSRELFDVACSKENDDDGSSVDNDGFGFVNDKRMGTDRLNANELWEEMQKAQKEWVEGSEEAGDWLSAVLSCLEIEWV